MRKSPHRNPPGFIRAFRTWLARLREPSSDRGRESVTFSMHIDDAFALRAEAAAVHLEVHEFVSIAIDQLRRDAPKLQAIAEPGTSQTSPEVEELTIALASTDAAWMWTRAFESNVSISAVIGAALTQLRLQGSGPRRHAEPWATTLRSKQHHFYRELTRVCEEVAMGRCTAAAADASVASAFVARVMHVVPRDAWGEINAAARELCLNHPGIRVAHGRSR